MDKKKSFSSLIISHIVYKCVLSFSTENFGGRKRYSIHNSGFYAHINGLVATNLQKFIG